MRCEGTIVKIKKRKVDSGMSIHVEEDSVIPMVLGPFESLNIELKMREKIRHKFFTQMWKGVKRLWKVFKANDPLQNLRLEEDRNELAAWIDDYIAKDSEATDSDRDD
ncbi:hypothetical protein H5410_003660 [Solanum commersonii]|uniref:Uncharacterized protein n=1 Tax=Solanum commersonii TaxID=4109 RepID=A0A9J6B690_SOLCO|nr:hypothetical protein H5410_003660 [Solanum commersonii]